MSRSISAHRTRGLPVAGRLEAMVAITDLPAEAASSLLPPGLELLPQDLTPAARHPLILLLGEHGGVRLDRLPFKLHYREFVVALPFVRPRGGPPGPFCYLPLLLLDRGLPTWLGRWLYGFAKRRARIQRTADSFEAIRRSDGTPLLSARLRPTTARVDLQRARSLFEQPLISRGLGERWRYSRFDFGFEGAKIGGVEAEVMVHPALLRGLPAGPIRPHSAFRIETTWTLVRLPPPDAGRASDCAGARPGPRTVRS